MLPLSDVTVVDLTRMLPGQTCTLLLADLGARVIKVERPGAGGESRALTPWVGSDSSMHHQYLDRNKESVRLDLKDPVAVAAVHALIRSADAVVESFRPGDADRLGLGFDELSSLNPRLVCLSLSGYGSTGLRAQTAGHDLNYCAYAGLLSHTGPAAAPVVPGAQQADVAGGMLAAIGLLAGLLRARTHGRPALVEAALADAALFVNRFRLAGSLGAAALAEPEENPMDGSRARYRLYACADDRWLAVGALEPRFWTAVATRLGRPDLTALSDGIATAELEQLFRTRPRSHWLKLLEDDGTCVAPVQDPHEVGGDPALRQRGSIVDVSPRTRSCPRWGNQSDSRMPPAHMSRRGAPIFSAGRRGAPIFSAGLPGQPAPPTEAAIARRTALEDYAVWLPS